MEGGPVAPGLFSPAGRILGPGPGAVRSAILSLHFCGALRNGVQPPAQGLLDLRRLDQTPCAPSPSTHRLKWNPIPRSTGLCLSITTADAPTTASSPTWQVAWQRLKQRPGLLGGFPRAALPPPGLSAAASSSLLSTTALLAVPPQASDPRDTQHEDGDALLVSLGRRKRSGGSGPGPAQVFQ